MTTSCVMEPCFLRRRSYGCGSLKTFHALYLVILYSRDGLCN